MDLLALRSELAKPGYVGLSDAEAAAAINAKTVTVQRPVASADARRYLMLVGKWPRIAGIARGLITPANEDQALSAVALVEGLSMIDSFDLEVPAYKAAVEAQLAACAATGLIAAEDTAAIMALADADVPGDHSFGRGVQPYDVSQARVS